jgi:uncharacterized protein YjiS (DUF1127 family)
MEGQKTMTTEPLVNRRLSQFADGLMANSASTLELMMLERRLRNEANIRFFRAVGRFLFRHVIVPALRAAERGRIERELMAIDDRTLADIGIHRHQIEGIAERAVAKLFAEKAAVTAPTLALPSVVPTQKEAADDAKPALAA